MRSSVCEACLTAEVNVASSLHRFNRYELIWFSPTKSRFSSFSPCQWGVFGYEVLDGGLEQALTKAFGTGKPLLCCLVLTQNKQQVPDTSGWARMIISFLYSAIFSVYGLLMHILRAPLRSIKCELQSCRTAATRAIPLAATDCRHFLYAGPHWDSALAHAPAV